MAAARYAGLYFYADLEKYLEREAVAKVETMKMLEIVTDPNPTPFRSPNLTRTWFYHRFQRPDPRDRFVVIVDTSEKMTYVSGGMSRQDKAWLLLHREILSAKIPTPVEFYFLNEHVVAAVKKEASFATVDMRSPVIPSGQFEITRDFAGAALEDCNVLIVMGTAPVGRSLETVKEMVGARCQISIDLVSRDKTAKTWAINLRDAESAVVSLKSEIEVFNFF